MPLTQLDVVNLGISTYTKQPPLAQLSDNPRIAALVNLHWTRIKRSLLSNDAWTFATTRTTLVEATNDRSNVWGNAYGRPDAALKILWVNDPDTADMNLRMQKDPSAAYDLSATTVYCDVDDAVMEHTFEVGDDALDTLPENFVLALAAMVVMPFSALVGQDDGLAQTAAGAAEYWLDQARTFDEAQRPPAQYRMPAHLQERGATDPDQRR